MLYNQAMTLEVEGKEKVGVVIAAAGASRRMGEVDKLFLPLAGKPILSWAVEAFEKCPLVDQIVIVLSRRNIMAGKELVKEEGWSKVSRVCLGGRRRQDSVAKGLSALKSCQWIIIHDGARPLVSEQVIIKGLEEAKRAGAAVAAVPVIDTIKVATQDQFVVETPPRCNLWAVQTPQVFRSDIIAQAYKNLRDEVTDDASLVEALGFKVKLYMGSYDNIKITTKKDLILAEMILKGREG